jgi:hypothetical protein
MKFIINGYIYKNIYDKSLGYLIGLELFFLLILYLSIKDSYQRLSYIFKTGELYYPYLCSHSII